MLLVGFNQIIHGVEEEFTYIDGKAICKYSSLYVDPQHISNFGYTLASDMNQLGAKLEDIKSLELLNDTNDFYWIRDNLRSLETLIIGDTIDIPNNAFHRTIYTGGHPNLTTIKESFTSYNEYTNNEYQVSSIGDYALNMCPKLKKVDLPGVRNIGIGAFANSKALEAIEFNKLEKVNNTEEKIMLLQLLDREVQRKR